MDSQCPTYRVKLWRMKMNCIINPARILNRFGNAWLIKRADGKHELVGGNENDFTQTKEWVSLFAHEIVFNRLRVNRRPVDRARMVSQHLRS